MCHGENLRIPTTLKYLSFRILAGKEHWENCIVNSVEIPCLKQSWRETEAWQRKAKYPLERGRGTTWWNKCGFRQIRDPRLCEIPAPEDKNVFGIEPFWALWTRSVFWLSQRRGTSQIFRNPTGYKWVQESRYWVPEHIFTLLNFDFA